MTKGKVVALRFTNIIPEQKRDLKGRYTSKVIYYVKVKAFYKKDQNVLDEILAEREEGEMT